MKEPLANARLEVSFDDLQRGDHVKARIGNERLWFKVVSLVRDEPANAVICTLASTPVSNILFGGFCTLDRDQVIDTLRHKKPNLKLVQANEVSGS